MTRNLSILFSLLIGISFQVQAQSLNFETNHVEMGEIRNWGLQPAVFHFENQSNSQVFILKTTPNSRVRINYPKGYIQPGQKDSLLIYYIPEYRDVFRAQVEIWTSDSNRPYRLSISGNVVSLDECPSVTNRSGQNTPMRLIRVVEQGKGTPIPGSEVVLEKSWQEKYRDYTDRKGQYQRELKPGLYHVDVSHEGYLPHEEEFYLDMRTLVLTFELVPISSEPEEEPQPLVHTIDTTNKVTISPDTIKPQPVSLPLTTGDSIDDRYLPLNQYRQNNIVFLVDVSSSMRSKDKLPLLKVAMKRLVAVLRSVDSVSLIAYANDPVVLSEALPGSDKVLLNEALDSLEAYGSTHGIKGMTRAYEIAHEHFIPGANNVVIIATDGEFNGEEYSTPELLNLIRKNANEGISCSVIGFGGSQQFRMRQMAVIGKGSYIAMSSSNQNVEEILVDEIKKQSRR